MSRKPTRVEELVELLTDEKATDIIVQRLEKSESMTSAFEEMIERKIDKIFDKLLAKIEPIIDLKVNELLQKSLTNFTVEHNKILEENVQLRNRVSYLETETRQTNLVLHGVEETQGGTSSRDSAEREAIEATLNLCNQVLGHNISPNDISTAFRIPKRGREKQRPIIVKFISLNIRNLIYRSRMQLRKSDIFVNEHLTANNAQIYARARACVKERKAASTWTSGGLVFVQLTDTQGCKPIKLATLQDVQILMETAAP